VAVKALPLNTDIEVSTDSAPMTYKDQFADCLSDGMHSFSMKVIMRILRLCHGVI